MALVDRAEGEDQPGNCPCTAAITVSSASGPVTSADGSVQRASAARTAPIPRRLPAGHDARSRSSVGNRSSSGNGCPAVPAVGVQERLERVERGRRPRRAQCLDSRAASRPSPSAPSRSPARACASAARAVPRSPAAPGHRRVPADRGHAGGRRLRRHRRQAGRRPDGAGAAAAHMGGRRRCARRGADVHHGGRGDHLLRQTRCRPGARGGLRPLGEGLLHTARRCSALLGADPGYGLRRILPDIIVLAAAVVPACALVLRTERPRGARGDRARRRSLPARQGDRGRGGRPSLLGRRSRASGGCRGTPI